MKLSDIFKPVYWLNPVNPDWNLNDAAADGPGYFGKIIILLIQNYFDEYI